MRFSLPILALVTLPFIPTDSARGAGQTPQTVAEIVTFRLAGGTDEATFLQAARQTEAFVSAAPGFIFRTLTRGKDGTWTDYILWRDQKAAEEMASAFMTEPSVLPFMQAIDPDSVKMRHETVLWQMQQ